MIKRTPIRKVRSKPRRGRVKGKDMEALRREVFERDFYHCRHKTVDGPFTTYCGRPVSWETGHLAHIVSRGAGGKDEASNLYCACAQCHLTFHRNGPQMIKPCPPKPIDTKIL